MSTRRLKGFTLIELLVALFITAVIFVIGYRGLSQAISSKKEVDEQSARLQALQTAMRTLEQDFELVQPRPVRNVIGDGYMPAFNAPATNGVSGTLLPTSFGSSTQFGGSSQLGSTPYGSSGQYGNAVQSSSSQSSASSSKLTTSALVTFTRVGWTNPVGIQRSEMQRVSYSIENGALTRSYYAVLDATEADLPIKRVLIEHVKSFNLRFMDDGHNWQTSWPPASLGAVSQIQQYQVRPIAVEVTIEIEGWGKLMRHIEVIG
jgi:general secretion pathway protein J